MAPKKSTKSGKKSISTPPSRRNTRSSNAMPEPPPPTQTKLQEVKALLDDVQEQEIRVPPPITLPRKPNLDVVRHTLRYVSATLDYALFYEVSTELQLSGFTDADWVGSVCDRRSTSDFMFSLGSASITWSSKKQPTVALSSTEAEYRGVAMAACEVAWLELLLGDLGIQHNPNVLNRPVAGRYASSCFVKEGIEVLPFFHQVAGNDAILFYGAFLFKLAGFGDQAAALYSAIIIGAVCLLTVSASLFYVDKVGRRYLLLVGCVLMVSTQVVIGSLFAITLKGDVKKLPQAEGITEVVMVCVFVMSFACSIGPLAWLIPSEALSQNVRSARLGVMVFVNMLFKFIIAQTFLSMLCSFKFGVFFFFAGWCLVIAAFVVLFLPETRNVSLTKMETVWKNHWFWKYVVYPPSPQQHSM
ncbi:hypothetical protein L7F22_005224 [Adiantum nelumboides]|nr:hypothetical protein [Adiantum nelumboides]